MYSSGLQETPLDQIFYLASPYAIFPSSDGYILYSPVSNKVVELNGHGVALLLQFEGGCSLRDALAKLKVEGERREDLAGFLRKQMANGLLFTDRESATRIALDERSAESRPQKVYIHLTHNCNLECVYCYNREHRGYQRHDLTTEEIKGVIREVKELGGTEISFTGGEPLLRKDREEIFRFAHDRGLKTYVITNGTVNDDKTVDMVARYVNFINVSLDSAREHEHEMIRGEGTWKECVTFIRKLVERGRSDTFARAVVTKHNIDNIGEYPGFVKSLGCSLAPISVYLPNSVEEIEKYDLLPDMGRYWEVIREYDRLLTQEFGKTNFLDEYFENNANCGMGNGIISIDSNGDVYPCQSLHFKEFKAGNIRENSLAEIGRESPQLKAIRDWRITNVSDCAICSYSKVCGGGCRAIAYNLTRDVNGFNGLFCSYYKKLTEFWLNRVVQYGGRCCGNDSRCGI